MARLASQIKAGFYPAPNEAIDLIVKALAFDGDCNVLDPCAGKGKALRRIVDFIDNDTDHEAHPYAVELDEGRAQACMQEFGKDLCLAPADVFNCQITAESIQLLYLNPPYDNEIGGGGTEINFLHHCYHWLAVDGILVYVVPESKIGRYSPSLVFLQHNFDRVKVVPFPSDVRQYKEVMCVAVKMKYGRIQTDADYKDPPLAEKLTGKDHGSYVVPKRRGGPRTFNKAAMTPAEMMRALQLSPLQRHLQAPQPLPLARPPLPLSKGHTAVLLSAGHLNGVVRPPGEPPHIIRGSCIKETYIKEQTTEERDDGTTVDRRVESERFVLSIRAVTPDGVFHNLKNEE